MTWVLIKEWFCKSWLWLKTHWQVPFLALWTLIVYLFTKRNTDALSEVLKIKEASHREEVEALKKLHKEQLLKLNGLQAEYIKTIRNLEQSFQEQKKQLSKKQVEDVKEIVIKSKGNPEEIKRKIENEFGIKFKD